MSINPQVTFLKKIYSILTAAEGNKEAEKTGPMYFTFCNPGIPLTKSSLNFDISKKDGMKNLAQWSQLVNTLPGLASTDPVAIETKSGVWMATGGKVYHVYEDFLNGAQCNLPNLTEDEKVAHDSAINYLNTTLTDPVTKKTKTAESDAYMAYKLYRKNYQDAVKKYNSARITAMNSDDPQKKNDFAGNEADLLNDIETCYDDWLSLGNKEYVEEALDILANLSGKSFVEQLKDAQTRFTALSDPVLGAFYPSPPTPIQFFEDSGDTSWTNISYDSSEKESYTNVSDIHVGGSTGGAFGSLSFLGFNVGASTDLKMKASIAAMKEENWKITFDIVQLPVSRGWLREDLLRSSAWFWRKNAAQYGSSISLGHFPLKKGEKALMPVYPTSVLLVRNVVIEVNTKALQNILSSYEQSLDVHIGWGPINLGNIRTHSASSSEYNHVTVTDDGLKSEGISIIGFVCDIIEDALPSASHK